MDSGGKAMAISKCVKLLTVTASCLVLFSCAAGSNFTPKTPDGAMCKAKCAQDMAICQGSSYTCDRAVSTCMTACQELDNLVPTKPAK